MAEKYFFHVQPYLATEEMQIKTTLWFHFTWVRMAEIKTTNAGVFVVKGGYIFTAVGIQTGIVIMEINGEAPENLE